MRRYLWLGLVPVLLLLAGCPTTTQDVDGPCPTLGSTQVRAQDHTTWKCVYPDNDPSHLHWVKLSG